MSYFAERPTMAEIAAERVGKSFQKGPSRLDEKEAKDKDADRKWEVCKKAVDKRDGVICQCCKRRTVKTIELDPKRAEHHHIVRRRKEKALMTDPRNVVLVCLRCHEKITKGVIAVVQAAVHMFELNGQRFIDAYKPLQFVKEAA